jgi:hypothetical protein
MLFRVCNLLLSVNEHYNIHVHVYVNIIVTDK